MINGDNLPRNDVKNSRKRSPSTDMYGGTAKKAMVQLHLDFGQCNFYIKKCPTCGFVYTPGDKSDEALHKEYHLSLQGGNSAYINKEHPVLGPTNSLQETSFHQVQIEKDTKIVSQVIALIESDFKLELSWLLQPPYVLYVGMCNQTLQVIGCLFVETLKKGINVIFANTKLMMETSRCNSGMIRLSSLEEVYVSKAPSVRPRMGVVMLWTLQNKRRKGLASRLLDYARSHLYRGYVVPKEELAFFQLNDSCTEFVSGYFGKTDVLMYDNLIERSKKSSSNPL